MKRSTLPSDLARVVPLYLEGLSTPFSLTMAVKLRNGDWDGILGASPDPRDYLTAGSYLRDAAASALLRKCADLPSSHDKRATAKAKWYAGEKDCLKTNLRISRYLPEYCNYADRDLDVERFLSAVRKIILGWIGPGPTEIVGKFGPGATFGDKGGRTTIPDKMSSDPTLTHDACFLLPQWAQTKWGASVAQHRGQLQLVRGNRFATAPKTALTDRAIAVEPSFNVFYQLGVGTELKRLLARAPTEKYPYLAGWDLKTAQEVHRRVARESSLTLEYCTLDLSNASDTLSRILVKVLLPQRWYEVMSALRAPMTFIDGRWVMLEKFSSMGNGFTFELETIIFAAVACAVSREAGYVGLMGVDVFVFGDDIIVKNDVAHPLKSVLEFLGFTLNKEKSFYGTEPFRESCGGDYFAGKPVRPHYLKEYPNGPQDTIALANGVRRVITSLQAAEEQSAADGVRRAWFAILDNLPHVVRRCRGPMELGDIVIHDDQVRWQTRHKSGIRYLRAYRPHRYRKVAFANFSSEVVLACATYGTGNLGTPHHGYVPVTEGLIPRDGVRSHKAGWVAYS